MTDEDSCPVATGNWGCGAFLGDPGLKFILQWIASSYQKRKIVYHTMNDQRQKANIEMFCRIVLDRKITGRDMYNILLKYRNELPHKNDVLGFLCSKLNETK